MTPRSAPLFLAALLALAGPASAQQQDAEPPAMGDERCRLSPDPDGEGLTGQPGTQPGTEGEGETLSGMLDACGGVLEPPPSNNGEFIQPAPDAGETPVIPPRALPDQQTPGGETTTQ